MHRAMHDKRASKKRWVRASILPSSDAGLHARRSRTNDGRVHIQNAPGVSRAQSTRSSPRSRPSSALPVLPSLPSEWSASSAPEDELARSRIVPSGAPASLTFPGSSPSPSPSPAAAASPSHRLVWQRSAAFMTSTSSKVQGTTTRPCSGKSLFFVFVLLSLPSPPAPPPAPRSTTLVCAPRAARREAAEALDHSTRVWREGGERLKRRKVAASSSSSTRRPRDQTPSPERTSTQSWRERGLLLVCVREASAAGAAGRTSGASVVEHTREASAGGRATRVRCDGCSQTTTSGESEVSVV